MRNVSHDFEFSVSKPANNFEHNIMAFFNFMRNGTGKYENIFRLSCTQCTQHSLLVKLVSDRDVF